MPNPIFEQDAGNYTVTQALERFIPTIVWDSIRRRTNQLLYGGQGTGKTILLKRLSWPAMLTKPDFLPGQEFLAFYCDLRDLEVLRPLFLSEVFPSPLSPLQVAKLYASLHILHSLAETVQECSGDQVHSGALSAAFNTVAKSTLAIREDLTNSDLLRLILSRKGQIISSLTDHTEVQALVEKGEPIISPENLLRLLSIHLKLGGSNLPVGILLDQYEYMPPPLRPLINALLRRENQRNFFCILASRPYAFDPALEFGHLQPVEDFQFLVAEHFPGDREAYQRLLADIWDALRPKGPRIERLLEGGASYFAAMSSRSIRRFLNLCDAAGAMRANHSDLVRVSGQRAAAKEISETARDQFKLATSVPLHSIWNLMHLICERSIRGDGAKRLPGVVSIVPSRTTDLDSLDEKLLQLIRKAFEEGAIQFSTRQDAQSFTPPLRFSPAQIVAPALGVELSPESAIKIGSDALVALVTEKPRSRSVERIRRDSEISSLFLSVSFADLPEPTETRLLFRKVFEDQGGIKIAEGSAAGVGLIEQIKDQVAKTNATLIEMSFLRPNIILEMGLSLGLGHRIIPVLRNGIKAPDWSRYPFLTNITYFQYDLNPASIGALRDRVLAHLDQPAHPAHLLEKPVGGGPKLRVGVSVRTMAVYYPEARAGIWHGLKDEIKRRAKSAKVDVRFITEKPFGMNLMTVLDHLVWCISRSAMILIDTSGSDGPDDYGTFALGFSVGCSGRRGHRRRIKRTEEEGCNSSGLLSMWPRDRFTRWSRREDILGVIDELLASYKLRAK